MDNAVSNYFVKGAWLSFIYNDKGRFGEVKEVYGNSILMMTQDGYRQFYMDKIADMVRHG